MKCGCTTKGFQTLVQKEITSLSAPSRPSTSSLKVGQLSQTVGKSNAAPPDIQNHLLDNQRDGRLDDRPATSAQRPGLDFLATLEPGVVSIPNQATTSFSANKGNRGFGNQLSNGGHRANENSYRVNGISINDYSRTLLRAVRQELTSALTESRNFPSSPAITLRIMDGPQGR